MIVVNSNDLVIQPNQPATLILTAVGIQGASGENANSEDFKANALSGYPLNYKELTKVSGVLTQIRVWSNSNKTLLLLTQIFTYTSGKLTSIIYTNNRTSETLNKNIVDVNPNLTTITTS